MVRKVKKEVIEQVEQGVDIQVQESENLGNEGTNFEGGAVIAENQGEVVPSSSPKESEKVYDRSTITLVASMAYLVPVLPFFVCKEEPYARFHHNQALLVWILAAVLYLAFAFIPNVNIVAIPVIIMFHLLAVIAGMSAAAHAKARKLLFFDIRIINWEKL